MKPTMEVKYKGWGASGGWGEEGAALTVQQTRFSVDIGAKTNV